MAALLQHSSAANDKDDVCVLNSSQAMSNRNNRPSTISGSSFDRFLDHLLRFRVQTGRGFVQKQDPGFPEKSSRESQALSLPTTQLHAFRSKPCSVSLRQG